MFMGMGFEASCFDNLFLFSNSKIDLLADHVGFEPTTQRLRVSCSTPELMVHSHNSELCNYIKHLILVFIFTNCILLMIYFF